MRPMRKVACACQNCNVELRKFNFVVVFYTFWTQPAQKNRNACCVAPDAASFIELSTHYFTCYFSFWHFSNKQKQRMRKDSIYLLMKRKRQSAVSFTFIIQLACVRTGSLFFYWKSFISESSLLLFFSYAAMIQSRLHLCNYKKREEFECEWSRIL